MQVAVADRVGIIGFQENNYTGTIAEGGQLRVPVTSLDNLVADLVLPVPNAIKIYVEGAESLVFERAKSLLEDHRNEQKKRCRKILEAAGYDIFVDGFQIESNASRSEDEVYAVRDSAT